MAAMERDEVMKLVRNHLSTELEVSPELVHRPAPHTAASPCS